MAYIKPFTLNAGKCFSKLRFVGRQFFYIDFVSVDLGFVGGVGGFVIVLPFVDPGVGLGILPLDLLIFIHF